MADVFLATAMGIEGFERHVVIKRIHPHHAKHPGFVQMFLDEARLAASLHHHNIVQVHDIGQADGEYFYAMEYVHGEDLRQLLHRVSKAKQHVPLEHVIAIVSAAAAGLHHAHELRGPDRKPLGLVHRDVSPSNIIVDYDGNVKVVDFGIAKAAMKTVQTQSGVLKGKVAYMSPEQCRGKAIDRRSDVYALGIVLYELTTARRLFKGENDFMTMSAIVAGKFPPPSSRRKDLPAELEAIIMKALAKEPEDRFQTVQEMRVALDRFASSVGLRSSSTGLAEYMEQVFHGRRIEPWLVEGLLEPEDLTEDFDGSAEGLARVSMSAVAEFVNDVSSAPASSPLLKAQAKVGATSLADAVDESPRLSGAISIPSSEFPAVREPTASGLHAQTRPSTQPGVRGASAPMPAQWPTAPPPERRGRAWLIAVVAIPLIIGGVVLGPRLLANMTEGETRSGEPAPSIAPEPVTMPAASPTPASTPPSTPSTPPPSSDPAPAPAPEPAPAAAAATAEPVADSASAAAVPVPTPARANPTPTKPSPTRTGKRPKPAKPTNKTKKPPAKSGSADPDWNPDELLPD